VPYEYILANLLARTPGAVGVLFLDDGGETVDFACSEFSPYQMKVVGAYVGIYLRQLREFLGPVAGEPSIVHIQKESLHLYAMALPDGYCVVLAQRSPAVVALAERELRDAAEQLRRELFELA